MERKSKYSRGHGEHIRSGNPYINFRRQMKHMKYPVVAFSVFLLFFISAETTGDLWKADVVQGPSIQHEAFTQDNFQVAKKGMVVMLDTQRAACAEVGLQDCTNQVNDVMTLAQAIQTPDEANEVYGLLTQSMPGWDAAEKKVSCEKNLAQAADHLQQVVDELGNITPGLAEAIKLDAGKLPSSSICNR